MIIMAAVDPIANDLLKTVFREEISFDYGENAVTNGMFTPLVSFSKLQLK